MHAHNVRKQKTSIKCSFYCSIAVEAKPIYGAGSIPNAPIDAAKRFDMNHRTRCRKISQKL